MPLTLNRRTFIAQTSAALLGSCGVWSELIASPSHAPSQRLRLGCIGVGNRGRNNVAYFSSEEIVALCDVDRRYLTDMAELHPDAKTYRDYRELLVHPGLDGVVITTTDHTHAHIAISAVKHGLHVYCEKPLANTIYECRLMADAAKKYKVVSEMGNQHHSSDGYRRGVELLKSGVLGIIREAHVWTNRPLWPQGEKVPQEKPPVPKHLDWDLWLGPAEERPYHEIYHPIGWRGWWDFGGGALADMGPHLIDPIFWGLELSSPSLVEAKSSEVTEEAAPEWSIVRYVFARESQAPFQLTWYDGGKIPDASITGASQPPRNGALVIGEKGKLFFPESGGQPLLLPNEKGQTAEAPKSKIAPSPSHYKLWIDACKAAGKESGQCHADFDYGARLTELCLLGNLAIRTGKAIRWDAEKMIAADCPEAQRYVKPNYRRGWEL